MGTSPVSHHTSDQHDARARAGESLRSKVLYSVFGSVLAPLAGIATAPLLARALGADGRGVLAAAQAPLLLTTAIGLFGLQDALTYFVARHPSARRTTLHRAMVLALALGALSSLLTWLCAAPLADGDGRLEDLIKATALATTPSFVAALPVAAMMGMQRWRLVAVQSATLGVVRLGATAALFVTGTLVPRTALLVVVAAPLVSIAVFVPQMLRDRRTHHPAEAASTRALLGFGARVWVGALSGIVLTRIDQLVMVPLAGKEALGLYVVAVSVAEIPVILSNAVRGVVFSADSGDLREGDSTAVDDRLQQMARLSTLLTLAMALAVAATSWWWLPRLFGAEFTESVVLVDVLLAGAVLGSAGSVAGAGLSARNRPGLRSLSMTAGAVLNLAVLLAVTPRYGAMGGALSTLVGSAVAGNLNVLWLWRRFGLDPRRFYGLTSADITLLRRVVLRRGSRAC